MGLSVPLGLSAFYFFFGGLVLVVGISSIMAGYAFLRFRPWLKALGVLTSVGYLLGGVLLILSAGLLFLVGLLALAQATGTLAYLRKSSFRALFGP